MTLRSIFSLNRESKIAKMNNPEGGIYFPNWFRDAVVRIGNANESKKKESSFKQCAERLLGRKAATKEADSMSSMSQFGVAAENKKESNLNIRSIRFKESIGMTHPERQMQTKFRVVLLEEGMGNDKDAFYYSKEALTSAVEVFTGAKIFADHPTMEEEEIRPERSTRDILGHFENLAVEDGVGGASVLCGDVDILPSIDCDWARARMVRAISNAAKFPNKDFIGLSINASGSSEKVSIDDAIKAAPEGAKVKLEEAKANGIDSVKVVSSINSAVSCDLVTNAGAGGKVLNVITNR